MTVSGFDGIDKKAKPEPSLTESLKKSSGRNSYGRITVRHRGGGNKRKYRIIDFKRDKQGTATVLRLEYDPNRSANIALIQYEDGEKRYILAPVGMKAGHKIMTGPDADILPGNALPIEKIPVGTVIHNIELHPGNGAQLVRSAGTSAQLMAKESGDEMCIRDSPNRLPKFTADRGQRELRDGGLSAGEIFVEPALCRFKNRQRVVWKHRALDRSGKILLPLQPQPDNVFSIACQRHRPDGGCVIG